MRFLAFLLSLLYITGCTNVEPIGGKRDIKHTLIVYMAADNNLSSYVEDNIGKMRFSMTNELSENNNLIVYVDKFNAKPCLLNIYNHKADTVAVFNEMNSTDSEVFSAVLDSIFELYPAPSYGLIMWSHGSGWLNQNSLSYISSNIFGAQNRDGGNNRVNSLYTPSSPWIRDPYKQVQTRAFGYEQREGGTWMEIADLATALPDNRFDYILFDACSMANIEVVYTLRNKSDYFIGSALEIMAYGFPYDEIVEPLCNGDYSSVCQLFYEEYNQYNGVDQTAGVALVNNVEVDSLANCFKKIVAQYASDSIPNIDMSQVQRLDRYNRVVSFDMMDYMMELLPYEDILLNEFTEQFNKTVPFSISTPRYLDILDIDAYCGLSMYVPLSQYETEITPYFLQTDWSLFTNFGNY